MKATLLDIKNERRRVLGELARRGLSAFCEYTGEGTWVHAPHLDLLCRKIEEAIEWVNEDHEEHKLIIVSMPPRHGKSEVVSRNAPAWFLGRNPNKEIILASYSADLATDMSRDARRIFREYAAPLFGLEISDEVSKAHLWNVRKHRGKLQAAGANGPITGRGADFAIVDDPIKNMEEAESPTHQRKLLAWFRTTLLTRMAPGGAIILVCTRWCVGDLVGKLIEEAEAIDVKWDVVTFPALAEKNDVLGRKPGEALWPWRFSQKMLGQIQKLMSVRQWLALYQQNPTGDRKGALWTRDLLDYLRVAQLTDPYRTIISWDPATTSNRTSDEHGIVVLSTGPVYYRKDDAPLVDVTEQFHGYLRCDLTDIYTPNDAARMVIAAYKEWGATAVVAETNQGGEFVESVLKLIAGTDIKYVPITAGESKYARAEPVSALYEQHRIHHVGDFPEAEKEQCEYTGPPMPSPNRYDAINQGLAHLFGLVKPSKKKARMLGNK